jgi:WXG100 family type VII secretion target
MNVYAYISDCKRMKEEKIMLRVDYETLATTSKTLAEQGNTFEECINTMKKVIEALPDAWEADTSKKYVEQFDEAEPGLRKVRYMIEDMSEQLQKISDNFAQADSDMASQM